MTAPFRLPAALFMLAASTAWAQTGNSSLSGMVTYRDGTPANARVYVAREGQYRTTAVKFKGGRNIGYTIPGVATGRYELLVVAPGAQPLRIWGVRVDSFEEKQLPVVLDRVQDERLHLYREQGMPLRDDLPSNWQQGWLEGSILSEAGGAVEGTLKFNRGFTVAFEMPLGTPTLPAYFQNRRLPPGTYDLLFIPTPNAGVRSVRVEQVVVDQNARTILGTLRVPAGAPTDSPLLLPLPERKSEPILLAPPRRSRQ